MAILPSLWFLHIRLHFPTKVVNRNCYGVEHPEQTHTWSQPDTWQVPPRPGPSQGNGSPDSPCLESNESCGQTKALEQNQHHMDLKRVDMVDHKVRRTQRHRHHGNFASHRDNPRPKRS